jgi:hypothetical protein
VASVPFGLSRVMGHTIFITVHAVAAGIALLAGGVAIAGRSLFRTYLWSLVAMEVFLVLAIAEEWGVIDVATRVLFAAFAALGLYMVWRADQARRIQPSGSAGPSASYVAHVGFTLVALFDAFIVILVLDLGAPGWLVAAAGVLIAVAGHFALRALRERLVDSTALTRSLAALDRDR